MSTENAPLHVSTRSRTSCNPPVRPLLPELRRKDSPKLVLTSEDFNGKLRSSQSCANATPSNTRLPQIFWGRREKFDSSSTLETFGWIPSDAVTCTSVSALLRRSLVCHLPSDACNLHGRGNVRAGTICSLDRKCQAQIQTTLPSLFQSLQRLRTTYNTPNHYI